VISGPALIFAILEPTDSELSKYLSEPELQTRYLKELAGCKIHYRVIPVTYRCFSKIMPDTIVSV
jgi:hypothetical protein